MLSVFHQTVPSYAFMSIRHMPFVSLLLQSLTLICTQSLLSDWRSANCKASSTLKSGINLSDFSAWSFTSLSLVCSFIKILSHLQQRLGKLRVRVSLFLE